jgi:hypothetical protein
MDALRPLCDAERRGMHSHAERGNDHGYIPLRRSARAMRCTS